MAQAVSHDFEILRSIRRIVRGIADHSRSISRNVGLTVPQLLCLKALCEGPSGDVTMNYVSRTVQLSPATVSGIVDRLVKAGLVERERREEDRRKVWVRPTDRGSQVYTTLPTPMQEQFVDKFNALSEPDRLNLLTALKRVETLMGVESLEVEPILSVDVEHT